MVYKDTTDGASMLVLDLYLWIMFNIQFPAHLDDLSIEYSGKWQPWPKW
jgi:hypothetical protein